MTPQVIRDFHPVDWKKVRESIHSDATLSLRLFVLYATLALPITVLIDKRSIDHSGDIAIWLTANTIGFAGMWVFWYSFRKYLQFRGKRFTSWLFLFYLSSIGGMIQATVSACVLSLMNEHYYIGIPTRVIAAFFIVTFWLPSETVIINALDRFESIETEISEILAREERTRILQTDITTLIESSVSEGLKSELRISAESAQRDLQAIANNVNSETDSSQALTARLSKDIHELAERLWVSGSQVKYIDPFVRKLKSPLIRSLRIGMDVEPFNTVLLPLATMTICGSIMFRNLGVHDGIIIFLFLYAVLAGMLLLGKFIFNNTRIRGSQLFPIWVLSATLVVLIMRKSRETIFGSLNIKIPSAYNGLLGPSLFLIFVVIQITINLAKGAYVSRDSALATFSKDLALEAVRQNVVNAEIASISKKWARELHGHVQSNLLATSILLEKAERSGDLNEKRVALLEARHLLESLANAPAPVIRSVLEEVEHRVNLWQPLVHATFDMSHFTQLPEFLRVQDLGEILEEAIANAVRHGKADNLSITLTNKSTIQLEILVTNDGLWSGRETSRLGSEIFSLHSHGNWTLERPPGSDITKLTLLIG